jgi:1-deoxyxylulose-5-phosphate synthase
MQHVKFGRTGLSVFRLCLGTMTFGGQCDEARGHAILDAATEGGIDFLDTANVYPMGGGPATAGRTEEIIGAWLLQLARPSCRARSGPRGGKASVPYRFGTAAL